MNIELLGLKILKLHCCWQWTTGNTPGVCMAMETRDTALTNRRHYQILGYLPCQGCPQQLDMVSEISASWWMDRAPHEWKNTSEMPNCWPLQLWSPFKSIVILKDTNPHKKLRILPSCLPTDVKTDIKATKYFANLSPKSLNWYLHFARLLHITIFWSSV